jgi:hypothetical protein
LPTKCERARADRSGSEEGDTMTQPAPATRNCATTRAPDASPSTN